MIRLDKLLCHAGYGTRKEVKKLIRAKLVMINGEIAKKDDMKVDEMKDIIEVDGQRVFYSEFVYFMLNKPQGVISSTEEGPTKTVLDCLDEPYQGMFPVGRLDKDTEGLLLITNDGALAHHLLSPRHHVPKTYEVHISNPLSAEHIELLEKGITIDGPELCKPAEVEILNDHLIHLTITEGKFHQVKRMMIACDSEVTFLKRLTMGPLRLDETLETGDYRPLTEDEIALLKEAQH